MFATKTMVGDEVNQPPDEENPAFSWALLNMHSATVLVHAAVYHPWSGRAYAHAWIEDRDRVFDWQCCVRGEGPGIRGWDKDKFYAMFNPSSARRYGYGEAQAQAQRAKHAGPWAAFSEVMSP